MDADRAATTDFPGDVASPDAPYFSVLIATYNQAHYIVETLQSVADQTFRDYEIVIVNDGSTDDTLERVGEWMDRFRAEHPNRVKLETIPNGGQSTAFEHGFGLCSGRYVCLLDSDDRWLPGKLETVHRESREHPEAGMLVHPLLVIDAEGKYTGDVRPMRARLSDGDLREQVRRTGRQIAPATTGVVIRADVFRRLVPMPTKHFRSAADSYLTFGASLTAPVRAIETPLGDYRMHPGSNYMRRITSAEGLRYSVEMQRTVAAHFGLEEAIRENAYFMRHVFALHKFDGDTAAAARAYADLVRSTSRDPSYSARDKALFIGFWSACLVAPRPLFEKLWRRFQLRHTGQDRVETVAAPPGAAAAAPRVAE